MPEPLDSLLIEAMAESGIEPLLARRSLITLAYVGPFDVIREPWCAPDDMETHVARISFRMKQCGKHVTRKLLLMVAGPLLELGSAPFSENETIDFKSIAVFWRAVAKRIWRDKIAVWLCEQDPVDYDYKFGLCVYEVREM